VCFAAITPAHALANVSQQSGAPLACSSPQYGQTRAFTSPLSQAQIWISM
jgi:hypothetical protein